jgi:dihydroorotate dehydrogenase electron transfer subunit
VGGGVGIAPLFLLAKELKNVGIRPHILLGARSLNDHILIDQFNQYGEVYLTTDDGTLGTKGFVIDHEIWNNTLQFGKIFCCGPDAMMKAVAFKSEKLKIDCEVSLENMMACGFGVCLCCVTKTNEGNKCVCTDGPVFNSSELKWLI